MRCGMGAAEHCDGGAIMSEGFLADDGLNKFMATKNCHDLDKLLLGRSRFCGQMASDGVYITPTMTKGNMDAFIREARKCGWELIHKTHLSKGRHLAYVKKIVV